MNRSWPALVGLISLSTIVIAQGRPAPSPSATRGPAASPKRTQPDYSNEPFVIEKYALSARYENDGTGETDLEARIRVQNEIGAQQLHELTFNYDSASEKMEIPYLRVRKKDGTVVNAASDAAKGTTASVARDAAAYADYKETRITVPALAAGDELEYETVTHLVTPYAPGEFWFAHTFVSNSIVRDEHVEVSIPESRKVILRSAADAPYETSHANGRTIYRWRHSNLKVSSSEPSQAEAQRAKTIDVELTTFASWEAVARWYAKLEAGRSEPTPEIRAKTEELTHAQTETLAKVQAIYNYVSTSFRYVDLPLGRAGWKLRSAADIFSTKYGNSQDEHTLLAAMLGAAGIQSDAVLIAYTSKLDTLVPSPAQFDHVITASPIATGLIWMDPTTEVAPFELLASPLRDKSALLVPADGAGKIVSTPADPPFESSQHVEIDGRVSDLGKLTAHGHYSLRGDTELVLRLAFHRTPEAQWKDLGQTILTLDGIHGEVTAVKPTDPASTQNPFELDVDFTQSNFLDWSSKRARTPLPLLAIGLPDPPSNPARPIELGSPLEVTVRLKLSLPPGFTAQPPVAVSVARDYAEFKSGYRFADGTVTAERSLDFKMHKVSASRLDDYREFARAVAADQGQPLTVINAAPGEPAVPLSATADDLVEAGAAALNAGNTGAAIPLLKRAVELDPQQKQAWNNLGLADLRSGKIEDAVSAFQRQLDINPADPRAGDYLGLALQQQGKDSEAASAFRKQLERHPLDPAALAALGGILLAQHDYAQALPQLDKAAILSPDNAELQVSLGRAYLNTGAEPKALAAFEKAASLSPTPLVWNDIAFDLAESKLDLDEAQRYAESAVRAIAADLRTVDLQHLSAGQLRDSSLIAGCWDTLGWVHFQKGEIEIAERYVRAAWRLDQNGEVGDHLAQIYEKRGQKERAIHTYALALAASGAIPETRARLTLLLGGNSQIDDLMSKARPELAALRAIHAGKLLAEDAQANFLIVLVPGEKTARAEAARFISGSDSLRPLAARLGSLDYGEIFPDVSPTKIVRRATLSCSAKDGDCILALARPDDVSSVN